MTQSKLGLCFWLLNKTPRPEILFINLSAAVLKLVEHFPSTALPTVWSTVRLSRNYVPLVLTQGFLVSSLNSLMASLHPCVSTSALKLLVIYLSAIPSNHVPHPLLLCLELMSHLELVIFYNYI